MFADRQTHGRPLSRGQEVWLLKRAQILVGDIWGAFQVSPAPPTGHKYLSVVCWLQSHQVIIKEWGNAHCHDFY